MRNDVDDELIRRLGERAADPKRRNDAPQSVSFSGPGGTISSSFVGLGGLLRGDLSGSRSSMVEELPMPASGAALEDAQRRLGFALPAGLRRLWTEVADGGFGPGGGLLSVEAAVKTYRELSAEPYLPKAGDWPPNLLPIRSNEPGYDCLDVESGAVVAWDPEGLTERSGEAAWRRSFSELAPSLAAWLTEWVDSRPQHEVLQERVNASLIEQARQSRARIAAMTPEERRAMGLPDTGWERVVWGGLGLEEDE